MTISGRQKSVAIAIGILLVAVAVALNIGWIVVSWRTGVLFVFGLLLFSVIIAGVILNTIFLVREIRRNEQHDTFINSVTHELKTPVASIRLYLETLQRRDVDEAKRKEFYAIMLEDSDRLLRTINQVLRAARSGSALRRHLHSTVDMRQLVEESVEIARRRYRLGDGALTFRDHTAESAAAEVRGDPDDLQAAVLNLLDNAVKYSGKEVEIEVELASEPARGNLTLRVRDHGIGIAPDQFKSLFKRFYRVPESVAMRIAGTGLGLYIVRNVVERHGGKAWALSEGRGRGSTFCIQLPVGRGSS
jgi:signal transduction histidine kinase